MVVSCCAYSCTQRPLPRADKDDPNRITFHSFPNDEELLKKWIHAVRRKNWKPSKYTRLCSKHFTQDCYDISGWSSRRSLKQDAVPTIFDFPAHLQPVPVEKQRRSPRKRAADEDDQTPLLSNENEILNGFEVEDVLPSPPKKRKCYLRDFNGSPATWSQEDIVNFVQSSKRLLEEKDHRIRILRQKNRRLVKKITNLESLIQDLKAKNLFSEEVAETVLVY